MGRITLLLLLIVSPPWTFLVTSLKQKDTLKKLLLPRKSYWNPYHPNDEKILELLVSNPDQGLYVNVNETVADFSAEDSDYFSNTFGNLSDVETKITDRHLKINGRHYKVMKPNEKPYESIDQDQN